MIRHITNLYPRVNYPTHGIFIKEQLQELSKSIEIDGLIIKSLFPPLTSNWKIYHSNILKSDEHFQLEQIGILDFPKNVALCVTLAQINKSLSKISWNKVELVHIHYLYPGVLVTPFLIKNEIPFIVHVHGSDWNQFRHRENLKKMIEIALAKSKAILFSGSENYQNANINYGNKAILLKNGVNFKIIDLIQAQKELNKKWIDLITVANVVQVKGLEKLQIFANQKFKVPVRINIYGEIIDAGIQEKLLELFIRSENQIIFHKTLPKNDLIRKLKASDFYIHTSIKESFGIAVMEAMYAGLPIIATNTGNIQNCNENSFLMKTEFNSITEIGDFIFEKERNEYDKIKNIESINELSLSNYSEKLINIYKNIENND